jgi:partitioning defective protein 3
VTVHNLQTQSGILDPHDKLNDVVDDREQILALYEDCSGPDPGVPRGDGASGSGSAGTGSPDIFTNANQIVIGGGGQTNNNNNKYPPDSSTSHIDVDTNDHAMPPGLGLQVRRGSEPSLHQADNSCDLTNSIGSTHSSQFPTSKRWSAAPVCRNNDDHLSVSTNPASGVAAKYNNNSSWRVQEEETIVENGGSGASSFTRSGRLSMQFLGDGTG